MVIVLSLCRKQCSPRYSVNTELLTHSLNTKHCSSWTFNRCVTVS